MREQLVIAEWLAVAQRGIDEIAEHRAVGLHTQLVDDLLEVMLALDIGLDQFQLLLFGKVGPPAPPDRGLGPPLDHP